jgi:chitodextrinase
VTPAINGVAQTPQTFNSTATTQTITGLANGTRYTFRVNAVDANGPGPDSDPSAAVNVGAPTKPTGVAVTAGGDSRVTLAWTPPASTNGATITGYEITASRSAGDTTTTVGAANGATVTGLVNGSVYTFRVGATSDRGDGEVSSPTAPFTVGLPGAPSHVAAKPGNRTALVTFKKPTTGNLNVSSYVIQAYEGSTLSQTASFSNSTTQTFTGLSNGLAYKFRVRAVTNGGNGPYSPFSSLIVVGAPTAPGAPRVTPGSGSAVLHWTTAAANGAAIKKYVVTPVVNGVAQPSRTYPAGATSATISGLPNAKKFTFGIKATNARGTGPQALAPTVVIGAPTAPSNVTAKPGKGRATIHWLAPNANGSRITGYTITPFHHGTKLTPHVFASTATQQTITGLTPGSGWTFTVAATNSRGTGPASTATKSVVVS